MPRQTPTLKYLYSLQTLGIKPGLRRVECLLSLLGNPEKTYPSVIVAGTNGKGSTSAMIVSVLKEAGYRVGHYSSPHLVRFNERIKVSGVEITDLEISTITRRIRKVVDENLNTASATDSPSFFEFTTAIAFEHFKKKKVDIVVLEVGMGGRFDATNVTCPLVSVITSIGMDHCDYLGDTIAEIAHEKAGVIKGASILVTTVRDKTALRVIKDSATKAKAKGYFIAKDFSVKRATGGKTFEYESAGRSLTRISLNLKGSHQAENAGAAIKTIEQLSDAGFEVKRSALRRGLANVVWPGRFDVRRTKKKQVRLVFDCAHNAAGAIALRDALEEITPYKNVHFVIGVMQDKDIDAILSVLLPGASGLIVTQPATARSADAGIVQEKATKYKVDAVVVSDVASAVARAVSDAQAGGVICVTGSIFTVGEAMAALDKEDLSV